VSRVRAPVEWVDGNLLYGPGRRDCWALYRVAMRSYTGMPTQGKLELAGLLESFAYRIGADFRLLRVHRAFDADAYVAAAQTTFDEARGHREVWERYLRLHHRSLSARGVVQPECYLAVRLHDAQRTAADHLVDALAGGPRALIARARLALERPAALQTQTERDQMLAREHRVYERCLAYLDVERATSPEVQWLLKRPYTRGIGEPPLDAYWSSQAIEIETPDGAPAQWLPRGGEVLRLHDGLVERGITKLVVRSERGESHQAFLVLGALPDVAWLPGDAEVMFSPVDGLTFPVDVSLYCQWLGNRQARGLAEKRKVDAANQLREELEGSEHGPTEQSYERPETARELETTLNAPDRPPLLPGAVTIAVGAPDADTLAERVEQLRDAYGAISLHQTAGEQHRLFLGCFPAGAFPVRDYLSPYTVEQVGAMVPHATTRAGSDRGLYLGHTIGGGAQPVLMDLAEAAQHDRPPTIYLVGTLGSGKTVTLMLLLYGAALAGSKIVDIDPKGTERQPDHKLSALPGMDGRIERIELRGDGTHRGLLDPLRVAAPESRFDMTVGFLSDLLPADNGEWLVAIEEAVKQVLDRHGPDGHPTCSHVLDVLASGDDSAQATRRALGVHADSGLAQLGFGDLTRAPAAIGQRQIVQIQVRGLPHIGSNVHRSEFTREERIGQTVLRLIALYGMRVASDKEPGQHSVFSLDEASRILAGGGGGAGGMGLRMVDEMVRWGRSLHATPILASQLVGDAEALDGLIGTSLVFGVETEREADQALRLLHLDSDSVQMRQAILSNRRGRCVMRDIHGRVARVQVDPVDPRILQALDTTPRRQPEETERGAPQAA